MTEKSIIDLFAGAGGWEVGLASLGHTALGIEREAVPSEVAEAAGHPRLVADVAGLAPGRFAPLWGLIASPPCQAYSVAGNRLGTQDKEQVVACAHDLASGRDTRRRRQEACQDERSLLTVEPLRFALALKPRWIALEQVPPVAELWTVFAELLGDHGYRSAVGVLSSERFGLPQVRKRAFLIASLDGPVALPEPSYRSFDPRRHKTPQDELHLPRWISAAEALGWRGPATLRSNHTSSGKFPGGIPRSLDFPAFTVISSSGAWKIESHDEDETGRGRRLLADRPPAPCRRHEERCPPKKAPPSRPDPSRTVRITVEQASILQGFRHDYPWRGSRRDRFRQIGNAVCPPVARRVLMEAMRPSLGDRG